MFVLVLLTLFGIKSYSRLAQSEDPPFTFKVMVIQTFLAGRYRASGAGTGNGPDRAQAAGDAGRRLSSQLFSPGRIDDVLYDPRRGAPGNTRYMVSGAEESRRHHLYCRQASADLTSTTNLATFTPICTRSRATVFRPAVA